MNIVNIAYYEKADYPRLLQIADDREIMHDTWEEWHETFLRAKNHLISGGIRVRVITLNLDELIKYGTDRKIKNDGKARSQFVSKK